MTDDWKEAKINLKNKHRIHLRPLQQIVETTLKFKSEMKVGVEGAECNPKSLLEMMIFAGDLINSPHEELVVKALGPDADEALVAMNDLMETILTEE